MSFDLGIDQSLLPTLEQDDAALRAIKFFQENPVSAPNQTGVYYDQLSTRMFVNLFVIAAKPNKKNWVVNGNYVPNWIHTTRGSPITVYKKYPDRKRGKFDHPYVAGATIDQNETFQDTKSVGRMIQEFPDIRFKDVWRGVGEIMVPKVKEFIRELNVKEVPIYSSPQIAYPPTEPDNDIKKARVMHIALTDMPAFEPEISRMSAVCEGDAQACYSKVAAATSSHFEAGDSCHVCFVDAFKELIEANKNDNTYLKTQNATSFNNMSANQQATEGQPDSSKGVDNSAVKAPNNADIELAAKMATSFIKETIGKSNSINEQADPMATFKKAYGIKSNESETEPPKKDEENGKTEGGNENNNQDAKAKESVKLDPDTQKKIDSMQAQLDAYAEAEKRKAIRNVIPLPLVFNEEKGVINEKRLDEYVNFWIESKKTPEEIAKLYTEQFEALKIAPTMKVRKASMSDDELQSSIANQIAQSNGVKFPAPQSGSGNNNNNEEKVVSASMSPNGDLWFLGVANAMVSAPTKRNVKPEDQGASRRMID